MVGTALNHIVQSIFHTKCTRNSHYIRSCVFDLFKYCQFSIVVLSLFASKCDVRCPPKHIFLFWHFSYLLLIWGGGWGWWLSMKFKNKKEFSSGFVVKLELPPVIYRVHRTSKHPSFSTVPQCIQIKLSFSLFNADFPL